jgi:hypothetical protein
MRNAYSAMLALLAVCFAGCQAETNAVGCTIEGPNHLIPEKVRHVQLGMSKGELESVLGEADYSPTEGQFYFSTGGDCPLEGSDRPAACGVVAEFRESNGSDLVLTESLQACWWGGIGE